MTDETAKEIVKAVVYAWRRYGASGRGEFRVDVIARTVKTIAAGKSHYQPEESK